MRRYRRAVLAFHAERGRSFPWRDTTDPYAVLLGEILLQRTRGEHVEPVYREVMRRWPTPARLSRARKDTLARVLRPLGLTRRSAVIARLASALAECDAVPTEPSGLLRLPGVGRYTAHAVPVFTRGRNLPLVDWVIARVLRRYFGLPGTRRPNADEPLWELATAIAAAGRARDVWLGTLDLAAAICRPQPRCDECPLRAGCDFANT